MKTFTCPICDKPFNATIRNSHIEACAKRPDDDDLRLDRENGLNYSALADKYGVCDVTVKRWCAELGIDGRMDNNRSRSKIKVYPDLTVLFGAGVRCVSGTGRKRQWCVHYDWCMENQREWVKCEAPDQEQIDGWKLGNTEWVRYGDVE